MKSAAQDAPIHVRFGDILLAQGYTVVPNLVLKYYVQAGITDGEMLFTLHVWQFWWGARNPYPSVALLAARMGKTSRQVRRYMEDLQSKGLLTVVERFGGKKRLQMTSEFDFKPMLDRLRMLAILAGEVEVPGDVDQVERRVRTRGDKNVRPSDMGVPLGLTRMSAEENEREEHTRIRSPQPPAARGARRTAAERRVERDTQAMASKFAKTICPTCNTLPCQCEVEAWG